MSYPQSIHAMAPEEPTPRDSAISRSSAASGSRSKQSPQQQLSTIEKSVTHLLVATKQLLETLTMWSTSMATEGEVSDVYVRLGYEFNIACRAFNAIGVDTSDLGPVPDLLRTILEETLSQEASKQSLEKYLPRIRDIVINLLHGLKKKQQRLRGRSGGSNGSSGSVRESDPNRPPRQASTASTASVESSVTQQLEELPTRHMSNGRVHGSSANGREEDALAQDLPPRTTSALPNSRTSPKRHALSPQSSFTTATPPPAIREPPSGDLPSSPSSNALQDIPTIPPYPNEDTMPTGDSDQTLEPTKTRTKPNDALTALQRGGELERRASRRFSAYHLQKHLGSSVPGIPALPPTQNSPVPNRGRDARESMNAVRSRGSVLHNRARSRNHQAGNETSPSRDHTDKPALGDLETTHDPAPQVSDESYSPVKTPDDKLAGYASQTTTGGDSFSATVKGPLSEPFLFDSPVSRVSRQPSVKPTRPELQRTTRDDTPQAIQPYVAESSPQPGKELTLFLQYKSKIKKFVLPDGGDLSLARLQLAFIEKFAWNTHNHGVDLPEIYIQDPVSGVRHELEDLNDIKERAVLVLNVEALDEVKRHFDEGLGGLRRLVEGIRHSVDDQQSAIQSVSERQKETAKELASIAAAPAPVVTLPPITGSTNTNLTRDAAAHLREVQSLRRDLAVVRQTYNSFVTDITSSMATMRTKAAAVKTTAVSPAVASMNSHSGRAYVDAGKKTLSEDSENIVNRVDDLQDIVEDLRKDVVTRGVRPLPRQLESVSRDISIATASLKKLQEYLAREKPIWTKIWEKELQLVCDDRDLLTMQEELATDLEDDLEKAAQTFALVEEATRQQSLQNPANNTHSSPLAPTNGLSSSLTTRTPSRSVLPLAISLSANATADPHKAKDSVLGEVRALQPNHESRLEAIERAEKARQRELESRRGGEFQRELGDFVAEGKLKKSGGIEEVERMRLIREEQARREVYERAQARAQARAEKERERAAATAAAAANSQPPAHEPAQPVANAAPEREPSPEPAPFVDAKENVVSPPAS